MKDGDWVWVISHHGRIKVEIARTEAVNGNTIWTWNAIGKRKGAWALDADAPEATKGFLLNHLIHELLPPKGDGMRWSNSDPITGQAAWYDLRVRIEKAEPRRDRASRISRPIAEPGGARASGRTSCATGRSGRHDPASREADAKKLGLVIDLDVCVGCHACVVSCKEWNTGGYGAALSDQDPYGADVSGTFLNRIHSFEVVPEGGEIVGEAGEARIVHFPKSCLHCDDAPCVTVCPTGASYKRAEDGIVLVDEDKCIGCGLCAWACPYGAREMDLAAGVMKKCTLCVDRIYNETLRGGRPRAVLRPDLSGQCPAFWRPWRSAFGCFDHGGRARRHRPDAGAGDAAGQQIPAAAPAQAAGRQRAGAAAENTEARRASSPGSTASLDRI